MADYAVSTAFTSKDGVTTAFRRMGAAAGKFGARSGEAFGKANRSASTFKSTLGAILSAVGISRGIGLLQQGVRGLAEETISFDDAITQAGAKFPQAATRGTKAFKQLQTAAREVGANTKFSATEAAEGLDFLAMAGFNQKQAMAALPGVTNLAVVANTDLARATDIASDALGAFNLMTNDSAQLMKNLNRVNDVFARTTTSANTNLEMLYEAMKEGGPVITSAGQDVETFSALTGKLADAGIKGSKAGTDLRNMFLSLQAPVPAAKKLMKKLKIDAIDPTTGSMRDIIDIIGDFNKKTAKMGDAQRQAALKLIFGKRSIAAMNILLATGSDRLRDYRDTLYQSGGAAQEMADNIGKSLGNRLKSLKSAVIETGLKFVDTFETKIPGALDSAIAAVRQFDVKAVVDGIRNAAIAFDEIKKAVDKVLPVIVSLTAAKVAYMAITKTIAAYQAYKSFLALAPAIQGAAGAQSLLNAAMVANPIGLVVAAVGLLVAAGYMLFKQWDNIKLLFNFLWQDFKAHYNTINDIKKGTSDWAIGVRVLGETFQKWTAPIKTFFGHFETGLQILGEAANFNFFKGAKPPALPKPGINKPGAKAAVAGATGPGPLPKQPGAPGPGPGRIAPNREDVAAQNINFQGTLTVAGAPKGSRLEGKTRGAPPVKTELAGANI